MGETKRLYGWGCRERHQEVNTMRYVSPGPSYMERIVPVPPEAAEAALDLALLDVGRGSAAGNGTWIFEVERGKFVVRAPSVRSNVTALSGVCPLRRTKGVIRSGLFRFPVELELLPWSETATAIGLRPS